MRTVMMIVAMALVLTAAVPPKKDRYVSTMEEAIKKLEVAKAKEQLLSSANQFERIGSVEIKEWLPGYWAAYAYIQASRVESDKTQKDALLDKADGWIEKGLKLSNNNDELLVMKALSAQARLPIDPMNRWMKYGPVVNGSLEKARAISASNPRVDLLIGQNIFFTPEGFGGGKKNARPYFETALQKFGKFSPASSIAPNWGQDQAGYFLEKCK